jgi:hypothetical protein
LSSELHEEAKGSDNQAMIQEEDKAIGLSKRKSSTSQNPKRKKSGKEEEKKASTK